MPLHRIEKGVDPVGALQSAVAALERAGEAVVRWDDQGHEWVILTRPPKNVEYRRPNPMPEKAPPDFGISERRPF